MKPEEKQVLIERCEKKIKELSRVEFGIMHTDKLDLLIYCEAIAALTAQPVKLPKKEKALIGRDYLYVYCAGPVENAIRSAGYEVQE